MKRGAGRDCVSRHVCVQECVIAHVMDAGKVFVCTRGSEVAHGVKSPKQ